MSAYGIKFTIGYFVHTFQRTVRDIHNIPNRKIQNTVTNSIRRQLCNSIFKKKILTTTEMNMQNFPTCFTQIKYKSTDIIRHIMNLNEQILSCILNGNIY